MLASVCAVFAFQSGQKQKPKQKQKPGQRQRQRVVCFSHAVLVYISAVT